jgi:hypothetical protein
MDMRMSHQQVKKGQWIPMGQGRAEVCCRGDDREHVWLTCKYPGSQE